MAYDTRNDTITVNDIKYDVEREQDRGGSGEETLTIKEFSAEEDDWIFPFEGLEGTLSYEQYDMEVHNPRDWSNVGTMAVTYSGYNLGDEDIKDIDFEVECGECEDGWVKGLAEIPGGEDTCAACDGNGVKSISPVEYFKKERGARVVLPLCVYEHSGMTMYIGARGDYPFDSAGWDTSFVGFIFDTPEGVKQCIGDNATDEEIEKALVAEVVVYASYLEGDITWWSVQDDETNFSEGCGGYVGDHKLCEDECFAALEQAIIKRLGENDERAHWNSRDVPTK